ncbi:MAG: alpha/beta fold hydrolase [Clostridia bacterium]|nr:alpha/beta fold hydrolase [Clostridia bacterium]
MIWNKIEEAYQNAVYSRADATKAIFYFSSEDFEGLEKIPFAVRSSKGHRLQGYFYQYPNPKQQRIIVFEHGMGSGHRGYMKEIELLAKQGYLVYAYDHTGCMESGGETTGGFSQSLADLDDVLNAFKKHPEYKTYDISVIGHSWGGFSALNISALHPHVSHIVAISGFVSLEHILKQFLGIFYKGIYEKERKKNPKYTKYNAIQTLLRTKSKVLVIHSDDDKTVSCQKNFDVMHKALVGYENITFWKVSGKGHNPNYTADAVKYKDAFFKRYQRALKNGALETDRDKEVFAAGFDWDAMTTQDTAVWARILEFLEL